jgi:hypothetical protein
MELERLEEGLHKLVIEKFNFNKNKLKKLINKLYDFKKKNLKEVSWEGETCLVPKKKKNYHIVSGFEGVETLIPEQEDENYDDKLKAQDHLDEIKTIEKINK